MIDVHSYILDAVEFTFGLVSNSLLFLSLERVALRSPQRRWGGVGATRPLGQRQPGGQPGGGK